MSELKKQNMELKNEVVELKRGRINNLGA